MRLEIYAGARRERNLKFRLSAERTVARQMSKKSVPGSIFVFILLAAAAASFDAHGQQRSRASDEVRLTFVPLSPNANAVIAEPQKTDTARSRIAILVAHPEHLNTFSYELTPAFVRHGYRVMMLNYYGKEVTYEEFLAPVAAAVRFLRNLPGVERVVLVGHSSGGPELTFYQDVAENGPRACQGPERLYPCDGRRIGDLPKADGIMLLEINIGGPLRALGIDPAVDNEEPGIRHREFDMFDPENGFSAGSHAGHYSADFKRRFFAAQQARNQRLLDDALARLAKIEKGEGRFRDDEPYTVAGGSVRVNGARLDLADRQLLARTHAPHLFLKADGTSAVQIVPSALGGTATSEDLDRLYDTAQMGTVRHYLSFYGLRTRQDFGATANDIRGIDWRSSANSAPGNIQGITIPTLVMAGTCAAHLVPSEITYDHSVAKDKQFVAVEGADHFFRPCKPEYGDTEKRAFDYVDAWLMKTGRF